MMKIGKMALLLIVFAMNVGAEEFPPCNFGKDQYYPGGREFYPGENVERSNIPVKLAMLGGKHRKTNSEEKPYYCKAEPPVYFVTKTDEKDPKRRYAVAVFPCFNPIVNEKYGLEPITFKKSLRDEIPSQAAKATEEDKQKKPRFWDGLKDKEGKKKECLGYSSVGFMITSGVASYGITDRDHGIRNAGILALLGMMAMSKDSSFECNLAGALIGAGAGSYLGDRHHEKEEREKAQQEQQQPAQQDVVGLPPVGNTSDGNPGEQFPDPDPLYPSTQ